MKWQIGFSKNSLKFLQANHLDENFAFEKVKLSLKKLEGEDININIKKLTGKWEGFHRVRDGKLRIIIEFDFKKLYAHIEEIDWRGNSYK